MHSLEQLQAHPPRPAAFLDRDGVLNIDKGYVGRVEDFEWMPGAIDALRLLNASGYYVFVVTNQSGIGRGKYTLEDYWQLRTHIRTMIAAQGVHIDDERFSPWHEEASVPEWRGASDWRKPNPGMILDLMRTWPVQHAGSFMIGDKESDMAAARAANLPGWLFSGGNLHDFVQRILGG
jgi:D-glycero-D-manno-heptose 1,7-bisphosphate phosphatase